MMISAPANLKNRNYMATSFSDFAPKNLKLSDVVVAYNDGLKWKVIPLSIMNEYPIIHDEYNEQNSDVRTIISIYVCPYTLYSCIYFGKYELHNKMYNNNITIVSEYDNVWIIPILNKVYSLSTDEVIDKYIKKSEVKIITLKNVLYTFPDCSFIDSKSIPKQSKIVKYKTIDSYISNKKLVYIIEYKSQTTSNYKYTIIIPKHNTFNIIRNGFGKYFHNMVEKIRIKGGIVHTCLLDDWNATNIASKTINL